MALVFRSSGPNRLTLGGDLLLTDSKNQLMRAEALQSNVMNLRAISILFVIIIKKKNHNKTKLLEEILVINPDICNIKITLCSAGFSLGCSASGIEHAVSGATDYQDTSYSVLTHTLVVSPTACLHKNISAQRLHLIFAYPM